MTDDEINRKFDAVANLMADLTISVGQLGAKVDTLVEVQRRAEERWERTQSSVRALLAAAEIQAGEIKALSTAVQAIDERQRHTDDRLNALIGVVGRLVSDRTGQG
jgi:uncharacterized protein YoxC